MNDASLDIEGKIRALESQRRRFISLRDGEFALRWGSKAQEEINKIDRQLEELDKLLTQEAPDALSHSQIHSL